MAVDGEAFVSLAWRTMLGRDPDPVTAAAWVVELERGQMDRLDVIAELADSAEGRARGVELAGLDAARQRRAWARWPLVGPVARRIAAVWRLPATLRRVEALAQRIEAIRRTTDELGQATGRSDARIAEWGRDMATAASSAHAAIADMDARLQRSHDEVAAQLVEQREVQRVAILEAERARDAAEARMLERVESIESAIEEAFGVALPREDLEAFYVRFEDRFRGSRGEIKSRVATHLGAVEAALTRVGQSTAGVLDVGAGRGEWLELLAERGIPARGIDRSAAMVSMCRNAGLDVVEADALGYLAAVAPRSLAAVTIFHVVEHLPFSTLVILVERALSALAPGGCLIVETPNPENLRVGACYFYLDPTHRRPLPPDVMRFLLEDRGFVDVEVRRLHAMPDSLRLPGDGSAGAKALDALVSGPQDYAVIGTRPLQAGAADISHA
ncbi:MAG: methyltransferase domain-containing protein [Proteobacteria bacterium]|nr:methyltransferase domain-containing protein [Pseudomonadota bacterium]